MAHFRIFLLNRAGRIEFHEEVEAPSDQAAISLGEALFRRYPACAGLEVWELTRLVHKELHQDPSR
ncbi:MAG TPA: hypothetical protein VLV50_00445 [Stellaceae bacterium]|nr:hypothetical protein [Stellaceae bacterium]